MGDTRKKADKIASKVIEARAILAMFDAKTIAEILRRGERSNVPDGMKLVSLEPGGGSSRDSSVESSALRGLPGDRPDDKDTADDWSRHVPPDPIGEHIRDILQRLDEVFDLARILDKRRQVVIHQADSRKGRQTLVGHCQACHRVVPGSDKDRLRSGYCNYVAELPWSGCYRMWISQEKPDRLRFERWVASQMAIRAEQVVRAEAEARHATGVVTKMPKVKLPNSAIEQPA